MPFSFPASPTVGQQSVQNGRTYSWSGSTWDFVGSVAGHKSTHAMGGADPLTPADIGAAASSNPSLYGQVGINCSPATEASGCRVAMVGVDFSSAALSSATTLAESNAKAALSVRPNPYSGYSFAVGSCTGTNAPYLQAVVYNGGSASGPLHIQPFGGYVGVGTTANPVAQLTIGTGAAGGGLAILPPSATAKRVSVTLDDWVIGQDLASNGTKDFFIYQISGARTPFRIDTAGNVTATGLSGGSGMGYSNLGNSGNYFTLPAVNSIFYLANTCSFQAPLVNPRLVITMPSPTAGGRVTLMISQTTTGVYTLDFSMPALATGTIKGISAYTPSARGIGAAAPTDILDFLADGKNWFLMNVKNYA